MKVRSIKLFGLCGNEKKRVHTRTEVCAPTLTHKYAHSHTCIHTHAFTHMHSHTRTQAFVGEKEEKKGLSKCLEKIELGVREKEAEKPNTLFFFLTFFSLSLSLPFSLYLSLSLSLSFLLSLSLSLSFSLYLSLSLSLSLFSLCFVVPWLKILAIS